MKRTRRDFIKTAALAAGGGVIAGVARPAQAQAPLSEEQRWALLEAPDGVSEEQARAMVLPSHFDLAAVKQQIEADPRLTHVRYRQFDEAPIEAASHVGNREIAEYLLGRGARFKIQCAVMLGLYESVVAFLDDKPELVTQPGAHGLPLMYHAAHSGDVRLLELLKNRGGGQDYDFALHSCAEFGNVELAEWLLAQGAGTEALNGKQKTPLTVALERGYDEVAAVLRRSGALEPGLGL